MLAWASALVGCTEGASAMTSGPGSTTSSSSTATASTGAPADGSSSSGNGGSSSGAPATTTTSTTTNGDSTTGSAFIIEPEVGPPPFYCDLFAQDCRKGSKCMPWAIDGGSVWNHTRCSEIIDHPGHPGDACTVEGSGVSGIDTCDLGVQCWNADPVTNVGTCVSMCTGDENDPQCTEPATTCTIANDGLIALCLEPCLPLGPGCPTGQACVPVGETWVCALVASDPVGTQGAPCEFINGCDPGLVCVNPSGVPGCAGAVGCCTELCDLSDPAGSDQCSGAAVGQQCLPWYLGGMSPSGYESVGLCSDPALAGPSPQSLAYPS
ncbi:MAG: hypothetical protein KDK70_00115 [Myxococcales bacterium]|nr:hypothetical protein [Myxococcales bacterium]